MKQYEEKENIQLNNEYFLDFSILNNIQIQLQSKI